MMAMYYYEVWVAGAQYHSDKALTYQWPEKLAKGIVVVVPMQRQTVMAVVMKQTSKPRFTTKDILRVVSATPVPAESLELLSWIKSYYPAPSGQIMSLLLPSVLTTQGRPVAATQESTKALPLPKLTTDQTQALQAMHTARPKSVLLHGDTGTGKTRLYLELAGDALVQGRSVLILTPEIGLTPQLALAVHNAFPGQTVIMHSDLTPARRREVWLRVLTSDKPLVVIGARSALFIPLRTIGLIVIDECHDTAYKQEQAPHYLATRAAGKLASLHGAQLIMGSATPSIQDYYTFQQKQLPIVRLTEQAVKIHDTPASATISDLKDRGQFTKSAWISDELLAAMAQALQQKQQSMLFLNRRGTARLILCQECGWQAACPRCDLPLTYHGDKHSMQCHTCGYTTQVPMACPECSANNITFRSIGTKALVAEVAHLLPNAVVGRFDGDTLKAERLEEQYHNIREGSIDILVGTQMLGKGLDLPRLSVLGIVLADTSLSFPDYTAEERTFQLLTQVMGRVQRGHVQGKVFVQTYQTNSPLLHSAIAKNYDEFFMQQVAERSQYKFPPFRYLLKLTCARATEASARKASQQLATKIADQNLPLEIIGPSPAFTEKTNDKYRWQLIIKATQRSALIKVIGQLPPNWSYDIDPANLL